MTATSMSSSMPAAGGVPKRLTWHPGPDNVLGWTPDGKRILFSSSRTAFSGIPNCLPWISMATSRKRSIFQWVLKRHIRRTERSLRTSRSAVLLPPGNAIAVE